MLKLLLDKGWTFKQIGKTQEYPASVPGDVTVDHFNNGIIKDPYIKMHYEDSKWILREDFEYRVTADIAPEFFEYDKIYLNLQGVDTYSDVYVNGTYVGKTENMFIAYRFDVKPYAKSGKNEIKIVLRSTLNKMDTFDVEGYFGTFNVPRLFVRKCQCHFGWDWAPNLPGYGIWQEVFITAEHATAFDSVFYWPKTDGRVTMFAHMNYNVRLDDWKHLQGKDTIRYVISKTPNVPLNDADAYIEEEPVTGQKNFITMQVEDPKLWWPIGYGDPNLYAFKVELLRDGKVLDVKTGRIGFREVELIEEPIDKHNFGYTIRLNGENVFCKGSNWVPIDCFTGVLKDEKYRDLITLAVNGNFNMLRVWGGGIYEKDIFYDLCDELGVMVWQDFMFACADIPEERKEIMDLALQDCEYNLKRLRNHPSIVYWCGGNEKTGAFGLMIEHGDFFVDTTLKGLVHTFDRTRPYARQSPCSFTDVGNDATAGESHAGSWTANNYEKNFRPTVATKKVSFSSECAVKGPGPVKSFLKYLPEDKVWPPNEVWIDRFRFNPYGGSNLTFVDDEMIPAKDMFGDFKGIEDFVIKSMTIHAETLRTEAEFSRSRKWDNSGFMNWMYSDIWPTGTWAIVDFYLECKMAYYAMKTAFRPLHIAYIQNENGEQVLLVMNDSLKEYHGTVRYGQKKLNGEIIWEKTVSNLTVLKNSNLTVATADVVVDRNSYLFAYFDGEESVKTTYFPQMWRDVAFRADYSVSFGDVKQTEEGYEVTATVSANDYLRTVVFEMENLAFYSDNYFDLEAGDSKTITIRSKERFNTKDIKVSDFVTIIK